MDIKEVLHNILRHYAVNRGQGHTHAMVFGAKASHKTTIIVNHIANRDYVAGLMEIKSRMDLIQRIRLLGDMPKIIPVSSAVVFDNSALREIFSASLKKIEELEETIKKLNKDNSTITTMNRPEPQPIYRFAPITKFAVQYLQVVSFQHILTVVIRELIVNKRANLKLVIGKEAYEHIVHNWLVVHKSSDGFEETIAGVPFIVDKIGNPLRIQLLNGEKTLRKYVLDKEIAEFKGDYDE